MTKKLLFVGLLMLAIAAVVLAADAVTGKWTIETPGRDGGPARVQTLTLKAEGAKLTGTISGGGGMGRMGGGGAPGAGAPPAGGGGRGAQDSQIANGKVDGNKISFEVVRETPAGNMTTKYEGVVSGDQLNLKITSDRGQGPQTREAVAKRSTT